MTGRFAVGTAEGLLGRWRCVGARRPVGGASLLGRPEKARRKAPDENEQDRNPPSADENEPGVGGMLGLWVGEALEERIGEFFAADGGGGAVAGINDGIVGEGVEAFSDGFEKSTHIAAGEVGAADATLEEGVASDDEAVGGVIKADTTR